MKTFKQVQGIIESCECELLGNSFIIRFDKHPDSERWFLQVGMKRECVYTGTMGNGFGGKYEVSPHSTEDEIVKKLFAACKAYVEHETREGFLWDGKRIFNPHMTVQAMAQVCDQTTSREEEG